MTADWRIGTSPADAPLTYPGTPPPGDALLYNTSLYPVIRPNGVTELGDWVISSAGRQIRIDDMLATANAVPMSERTPLIAVGSNRNPAQLVRKLCDPAQLAAYRVMPITQIRVHGIAVAHSAHIGVHGYVPYTAVARPGWHTHWAVWADPDQVAAIDGTEGNYTVVTGTGQVKLWHDLQFEIREWRMYRSRWGALRFPPDLEPLVPETQQSVWRRLLSLEWFRVLLPTPVVDPAAAAALFAHDEDLRCEASSAFAIHGCAVSDGLDQVARTI
jgi:hypothetical protein